MAAVLHGCFGMPHRDVENMVYRVDIGISKENVVEVIPDSISKDIESGRAIQQETEMGDVPTDFCHDVECIPKRLTEILKGQTRL